MLFVLVHLNGALHTKVKTVGLACCVLLQFSYGPDTPVVALPRVVNLAMGAHGEHRLFEALERLPLLTLVAAVLPSLGVGARFFFGPSKVSLACTDVCIVLLFRLKILGRFFFGPGKVSLPVPALMYCIIVFA